MVSMRIADLAVRLQDRIILENLSLTTESGILAILGPNGCGKTTLLRALSGELKPASGSITLEGRDFTRMKPPEIASKVAMVSQEHHPVFAYSVHDMVLMGRSPHIRTWSLPSTADREIAEQALHKVGIPHLRERDYTELSGGERKLVLIAMAVSQQTEMMLLDEPTAFLDTRNALAILNLVKHLADSEGKTILIALHDVNHALLCADRVLLIYDSETFLQGEVDEVLTAGNLSRLYGVDFEILKTESGRKFVAPRNLPPMDDHTPEKDRSDRR